MKLTIVFLALLASLAPSGLSDAACAQPLEYATSHFWASVNGVEVVGTLAYCALANGLLILDVSDPEAIAPLGRVYTPGYSYDVAIAGDYAYLADERAGIQIIDISDADRPTVVASYDTPGRATMVQVRGPHLFVADGNSGLLILDISIPTAPKFVSNYVQGGNGRFVLYEDLVLCCGIFDGLDFVDISDPYNPVLVCRHWMCPSDNACVIDDIAYVTAGCGGCDGDADEYSILSTLDISDPSEPVELGEYVFETGWAGGPILVRDGFAYGGYRDEGGEQYFIAMDVSDPTQPTLADSVRVVGRPAQMVLCDDVIYAAAWTPGLTMVNVHEPGHPAWLGTWRESAGVSALTLRDGLGYLIEGEEGLKVLDLADPLHPEPLAHLPLPGTQRDVKLAETLAYTVDFTDALNVIDVGDPLAPQLLASIAADVRAAEITSGFAYLATGEDGLLVYDLSDPAQPVPVGACMHPGFGWDVAVRGDFAYVCAFHEGLRVIDVSDPSNPYERGAVDTYPDYYMSLALVDDYAYVPARNSHLQILDVSDPDFPTLAATVSLNCFPDHVSVIGDWLYLGTFDEDQMTGLTVLDIHDRLDPQVVTFYAFPGSVQDVVRSGPYHVVATGVSLLVLQPLATETPNILPHLGRSALGLTVESPARGRAGISFRLPATAAACLDLFDITGRHQTRLLDARQVGAGTHRLEWDWAGGGIAAGTYFLRLRAGSDMMSRRVTLLR